MNQQNKYYAAIWEKLEKNKIKTIRVLSGEVVTIFSESSPEDMRIWFFNWFYLFFILTQGHGYWLFSETGREREKPLSVDSRMRPDQESNPLFDVQVNAPTHWATWPGHVVTNLTSEDSEMQESATWWFDFGYQWPKSSDPCCFYYAFRVKLHVCMYV